MSENEMIWRATDADGVCFDYYNGKPSWDGDDFGVGYGNAFNRYHGPNPPPPGECWEIVQTRKGDIDTDGDPIGWKIVGIGEGGSVLCEKPNGQRRRYSFGDWAKEQPSGEAWERLVEAVADYAINVGVPGPRGKTIKEAWKAYEADKPSEPTAQQATIERLTKERDEALRELANERASGGQVNDELKRTIAELQAKLAMPEMPECVRVDKASKTGWSVGDIVRCRHHSGAWRVWRVYGVFLGAVNQESVIELECLDRDANSQGWACVPEDLLDLLTKYLRPLKG